jgi:MraZ protein
VEDSQPTVFKGTYEHRIDAKGRLPVPAVFRRALGDRTSVVVTPLDQCLAAYPPTEWEKLEAQLAALPAFSKPVKALARALASRAADCALDVQGRILVPGPLRAAAGLQGNVVIIGVLNRFEIWAPETWKSFLSESERLLEDVSFDLQWPPPPGGTPEAPGVTPVTTPVSARRPQAKPKR